MQEVRQEAPQRPRFKLLMQGILGPPLMSRRTAKFINITETVSQFKAVVFSYPESARDGNY